MRKAIATLVLVLTLLVSPSVLAQSLDLETQAAWDEERFEQLSSQGDPVKEEQVVYSITPWTGAELGQGTIAVKDQDTIYLIADVNNLMNARITDVYYWPITKEYMANWQEKNIPVEGRLRIRQGNQVVDTLDTTTYVNYYPIGSDGLRQIVLGDEGVQLYERYRAEYDQYIDEMQDYYTESAKHQEAVNAILRYVQETGNFVAEDEVPKSPRQFNPPGYYVYAPSTAFVVNLPKGTYQIEMVDPDGKVVPGTTKRLVVFERRREGVSYHVRREHMWTVPFETSDSADVLYLEGRRVFYLLPHRADEYNVYQYWKSQNLHQPLFGDGLKSSWFWVPANIIDLDVRMQLLRDGEVVQEISYKPYYVQQTSGYGLGYIIHEYNRDDPLMFQRSPSFFGYRIELESTSGSYTLQLVDSEGNVLPGSVREIRSIRRDASTYWIMLLMPALPFVIGLGIYIRRRQLRPRSGKQTVES